VFVAIKGAPEKILASSALPGDALEVGEARVEEMASRGQRVLALASAMQAAGETLAGADIAQVRDLVFLGLVGLFDPPRASARTAIAQCRAAGIRVAMVTGDHPATARTVAAAVGLLSEERPAEVDGDVVDASELGALAALPEPELERLLAAPVIARATPSHKLELIELHQRRGAVVAMTGDGVNDAPALRQADIGIAMGRGTQVAREAAAMVLRDDELGSVVAAVEQGRTIFENIRKFVVYLLTCNVSEIFVVCLGVLLAGPLPILPLQILFLNLVTDVFPALALGVGAGGDDLMARPPRDPSEALLTRRHWREIVVLGALMAVLVLVSLSIAVYGFEASDAEATTIAFLTLALAQLAQVWAMRGAGSPWWRNEITRNRWVWGAVALCVLLLVLGVHWPAAAQMLSLVDPGKRGWLLALAVSCVHLLGAQSWRHFAGRSRGRGGAERE
jgi:Ca2+-transporting ATPase